MSNPNRIVIEVDNDGPIRVCAERPSEVVVIIHNIKARPPGNGQLVYGDSGLLIEPLAVVGEEVRFEAVGDD